MQKCFIIFSIVLKDWILYGLGLCLGLIFFILSPFLLAGIQDSLTISSSINSLSNFWRERNQVYFFFYVTVLQVSEKNLFSLR